MSTLILLTLNLINGDGAHDITLDSHTSDSPYLCTTTVQSEWANDFAQLVCPASSSLSSLNKRKRNTAIPGDMNTSFLVYSDEDNDNELPDYTQMKEKGWQFAPVLHFHPLET